MGCQRSYTDTYVNIAQRTRHMEDNTPACMVLDVDSMLTVEQAMCYILQLELEEVSVQWEKISIVHSNILRTQCHVFFPPKMSLNSLHIYEYKVQSHFSFDT